LPIPTSKKLYVFAEHLRRLLPADRAELPREVQQNIDMESYRIQQTATGKIPLDRKAGVLDPVGTKGAHGIAPEEMEALSRIIAGLNDRFGLNLGPEQEATLGQMMERLGDDAALAAARANTRENVRLTFDQKVEQVIQEIVDSNFELYKRITDDRAFGEAPKNLLFDHYLRGHRDAEELIKRGESKTLEFKSTIRWSLKEDRRDDKFVTHAALKTVAAFLNTDGGDLLIGVADSGSIVGIEADQLENDDKFMRHLAQVVRNGLDDRAGTCIDPKTQVVQSKTVCVVSCQRSPEPVFLKWKGVEATSEGDFFVRSGPGTVKLPARQHEGIHPNSVWVVAGLLICTASLTHAQYCDMSIAPINMKLIPMRTAHARSRVSNSPAIPLPTALYGAKFRCCQTRGFVPKLLIGRRFLPAKERISEAELDFSLLSGKAHSSDPPVCRGACAHRYCL
jgi:hypothetical protein